MEQTYGCCHYLFFLKQAAVEKLHIPDEFEEDL